MNLSAKLSIQTSWFRYPGYLAVETKINTLDHRHHQLNDFGWKLFWQLHDDFSQGCQVQKKFKWQIWPSAVSKRAIPQKLKLAKKGQTILFLTNSFEKGQMATQPFCIFSRRAMS